MTRRSVLLQAAAALMLLTGIIVFHPLSVDRPDGRLHIDFLDVGQGDAALVTFPDGRTLLVDGGGRIKYTADSENESFEPDLQGIGETVVSQFLWHRGYSEIDLILATHADADHIPGQGRIVDDLFKKRFRIGHQHFFPDRAAASRLAEFAERLGAQHDAVAAAGHLGHAYR